MDFLRLTPEEAATLAGPTLPGKALDPREATDGGFALPLEVLDDDHGEAVNAALAALPVAPASFAAN